MKKIIVVLIVVMMMITLVPALSVSAIDGDWVTLRSAVDYDDDTSYTPAAGYRYTSKGIETISPDYTNCTINQRLMTKERYSLTTNNDSANGHVLSLDFTVLDFPYRGDNGTQDEWISVSIWSESNLSHGTTNNGQGFCTLIRGAGDGSAVVQSCLTTNNQFGVFAQDVITVDFDDDNCEMYNMVLDYDGSEWTIAFNGKTIGNGVVDGENLNDMFSKEIFAEGAYVGVTFHSGQANSTASMLITNFNGSVPSGDDRSVPEDNVSVFADLADSSTVAANTPAVIWDSTMTSVSKLTGSNLEYTILEDGTIKAVASAVSPYITFGVRPKISYKAEDFPIVAVLTKDCWADSGNCYYCAGEVLSAKDDCATNFYLDDEELAGGWNLGFIDVPEAADETGGVWEGRINNIRIGFNNVDVTDDEYRTFTIGFIGAFRSQDEAIAFANEYLKPIVGEETTEPDNTTDVSDDSTGDVTTSDDNDVDTGNVNTGDVTTASADVTTATTTATGDVTTKALETTAAPETTADKAITDGETTKETSNGCGGVVGGIFAVLGIITLAGVTVRKKH